MAINECRHKLRWFIRGVYVLCSGVFIAAIAFVADTVVTSYNIPNLNSIFQTISISVAVISGLIGIGLGISYNEDSSHISDC